MNLVLETQNVLEKFGYEVSLQNSNRQLITFEDESIIGFVYILDSVSSIIDNWEEYQDQTLIKYAGILNADPNKSWNVYTIFLTDGGSVDSQQHRLSTIEDDLRGTRKIIGSDIKSSKALIQALLPILPIQIRANIGHIEGISSLKERLEIADVLTTKNPKDIYADLNSQGTL
jgi:hypothetical protein